MTERRDRISNTKSNCESNCNSNCQSNCQSNCLPNCLSNRKSISKARARVIDRGTNANRCCPLDLSESSDDGSFETDCNRDCIITQQQCFNSPKYNKHCTGRSCYKYTPVESSMGINTAHSNTLRINLASPIFDSNFNSKQVSQVSMIRNYDGSVDFVIKFDGINPLRNRYPPNPVYPIPPTLQSSVCWNCTN